MVFLERSLRVFPSRTAVIHGPLRWTYARFSEEVGRMAGALRRAGVEPSVDEIVEFCREKLAHFKCPKSVEFCELPKTSTGKIQKFKLRGKEWAGKERRIQGVGLD